MQNEDLKKPETETETKTNLAILQDKIGQLEKNLADLKIRSKENLDRLKLKLKKEQERLYQLIEDVKRLKPVECSISLYHKFLNWVKKEPAQPVRAIFCVRGTHEQYIRGYVVHSKRGFLFLTEAESIDFSTGHPVVMESIGSMVLNQEYIVLWYEA